MHTEILDNKTVYTHFADKIFDKRYNSPNPLRRYVHRAQYDSILSKFKTNTMLAVADIGCGEGVLSCLLAKQGLVVTGIDISEPNITKAKALAKELCVEDRTTFIVGDAEHVPFPDESFDVVISCHVLEHLPDFDRGVRELYRLTRHIAIVALPTILNLCSLIQAGRGSFWEKSKKSLLALPFGIIKAIGHLRTEGVDEGYSGHAELRHIWRYPWVVKKKLVQSGFEILDFEASTLCLPYFVSLLSLIRWLDKGRRWPILRNLGYGTTVVLKKITLNKNDEQGE